jgi:hypothetical protein
MKPRRISVFLAAAIAAALARPASADDQNSAAAAAMQGIGGVAGGGAVAGAAGLPGGIAGAAAGALGGVPGARKPASSFGNFSRQLGAPTIGPSSGSAPKTKGAGKKGKGKKAVKAEESKYKSRVLVENSEHTYRFDENGNPLDSSAPKKARLAVKKKPAPASTDKDDDDDDKTGKCTTDEPCTVKNTDADSL